MSSVRRFVLVVLLAVAPLALAQDARGKITPKNTPHGSYRLYTPKRKPTGMLVIVHGTPEDGQDMAKLAELFLKRWTAFADKHALLAVAPEFGEDFGSNEKSGAGMMGGYRGLFGKKIGADEFVNDIVERHAKSIDNFKGRIALYGHSAGAQFACRYAVTHPAKLKAVVLSAPGRFAYPDADAPWPYGQKAIPKPPAVSFAEATYTPKPDGWREAAKLPIAVVVGEDDTEPQPKRPAHVGRTRVDLAKSWTEAMTELAPRGKSRIRMVTVPGVSHSSGRLTKSCIEALEKCLTGK